MEYDFPVVDALDKVPEQFRPYYAEKADKSGFEVAESHRPLIEMYTGTNRALREANSIKKKHGDESAARRQTISKIGEAAQTLLNVDLKDKNLDTDLADILTGVFTELATKVAGGDKIKIDMTKVKEAADKRISEIEALSKTNLDKMRSSLERYLIDGEAKAALAAAKGNVEVLLPHVKSSVKIVEDNGEYSVVVVDEKGDARPNGKGGFMTISDRVAEMKANKNFAANFDSEAKGGSGTNNRDVNRGRPPVQRQELSSIDKISQGLKARQGQA